MSESQRGGKKKPIRKSSINKVNKSLRGKVNSSRRQAKKKPDQSTRRKKDKTERATEREKAPVVPKSKSVTRVRRSQSQHIGKSPSTNSNNITNREESTTKKTSELCVRVDMVQPKKVELKSTDIPQDLMKKLIASLQKQNQQKKERPAEQVKQVPQDLRSQIILDRVEKKKNKLLSVYSTKLVPSRPDDDDKEYFGIKGSCERAKMDFTKESAEKIEQKVLSGMGQPLKAKESEAAFDKEDSYSAYPKVSEIEKLPETPVMDKDGKTDWMINFKPTDDDKKGVEEECSVTADTVEEYNDKKLVLTVAPPMHITFDQWASSTKMKARDEVYFSSAMVFSNTLRSLINVTAKIDGPPPSSRKKKEGGETDDEDSISFGFVDMTKCAKYTRDDPIGTMKTFKEKNTLSE